jgi:hypothetical protein
MLQISGGLLAAARALRFGLVVVVVVVAVNDQ